MLNLLECLGWVGVGFLGLGAIYIWAKVLDCIIFDVVLDRIHTKEED